MNERKGRASWQDRSNLQIHTTNGWNRGILVEWLDVEGGILEGLT